MIHMKSASWILLAFTFLVIVGAWFVYFRDSSDESVVTATYNCIDQKTLVVSFYDGETIPADSPDEPPMPGGTVELRLDDGRTFTLPQTLSASGVRYANGDESVIFWNVGKRAFLNENNVETYSDCVEAQ